MGNRDFPPKRGGRKSPAKTEEDKGLLGLSAIRRNRGISLEQIAETTKIGVRALEAIERGEFSKLPGGIYNTSYIRQYARAIDYDEGAILKAYEQDLARRGQAAPAGETPRKPAESGGSFRALTSLLGL